MLTVPAECVKFTQMHRPGGDYVGDVMADFAMIEPFLPDRVDSIIDIGCGMAGIDVFLKALYPWATLRLLDGEGNAPVYGWGEQCHPYSSRAAAEALLYSNGVEHDGWIDIGERGPLKADLVISLLSWGFHYPLSAYAVEGFCIADLRRGREPARGRVIREHAKSDRCAFQC